MPIHARKRPGDGLLPIDWGAISPLRIHARAVADGAYAGAHRSLRRGAGIEFGGQRAYVPGDDLRFLDRRSLLRHDRLMVREFDTDTDRALWLCLDQTASMGFRGEGAPGAKLAYAALLAAACARIALSGGDPVGLCWFGSVPTESSTPAFGLAAFERLCDALERAEAKGDLAAHATDLDRQIALVARRACRGSMVLLLSDFLDLPERALRPLAALANSRVLCAVQVIDPIELSLGFRGKVLLRAIEGGARVTTDPDRVRAEYQERLAEHTARWRKAIEAEGGRFVRAATSGSAVGAVRAIVQAIAEARR